MLNELTYCTGTFSHLNGPNLSLQEKDINEFIIFQDKTETILMKLGQRSRRTNQSNYEQLPSLSPPFITCNTAIKVQSDMK